MNYTTRDKQLFLGVATVTNLSLPQALKINDWRSAAGAQQRRSRAVQLHGNRGRLPQQHIPGALFRGESQVGSAVKCIT